MKLGIAILAVCLILLLISIQGPVPLTSPPLLPDTGLEDSQAEEPCPPEPAELPPLPVPRRVIPRSEVLPLEASAKEAPGTALVQGLVLTPWGKPVSGIRVEALNPEGIVFGADSAGQGRYALFLPPDTYDLLAGARNRTGSLFQPAVVWEPEGEGSTGRYGGAFGGRRRLVGRKGGDSGLEAWRKSHSADLIPASDPLLLRAQAGSRYECPFVLKKKLVEIPFLDSETGKGVAEAFAWSVRQRKDESSNVETQFSSFRLENGVLSFLDLPDGQYGIATAPYGYRVPEPWPVAIQDGVVYGTLRLDRLAFIRLTARAQDGNPLQGDLRVRRFQWGGDGRAYWNQGVLDAEGSFVWPNEEGEFTFRFELPGRSPVERRVFVPPSGWVDLALSF